MKSSSSLLLCWLFFAAILIRPTACQQTGRPTTTRREQQPAPRGGGATTRNDTTTRPARTQQPSPSPSPVVAPVAAVDGEDGQRGSYHHQGGYHAESLGPESIVLLRRISERLTAAEAGDQHRARKLDSIEYRLTKLEILTAERATTLDKIDNHIGRKIETLDWEMSKISTLLEVLREELEKIEKSQMLMRMEISKLDFSPLLQLRPAPPPPPPPPSHHHPIGREYGFSEVAASHEQGAKLQVILTSLSNLRRVTDTVYNRINTLHENVTDIANLTRTIIRTQSRTLSKEYFYTAMKDYVPEPAAPAVITLESSSSGNCPQRTTDQQQPLPTDCSQVLERGFKKSGVYKIQPTGRRTSPFFAYCDMKTEGGGWTVIQRRQDGSMNFLRDWGDYKHGFGNLATEHWLGNEKLYWLTNQEVYTLRFDLDDFESHSAYAAYSAFAVGGEKEGYMIKLLGQYEGDAGDSFTYHSSMKFSTPDFDNDPWEGGHCAELHTGGWWYNGCSTSNPNGQYLSGEASLELESKGVYWYEWHGPSYSLKRTEIKIRPAGIGGKRRNP